MFSIHSGDSLSLRLPFWEAVRVPFTNKDITAFPLLPELKRTRNLQCQLSRTPSKRDGQLRKSRDNSIVELVTMPAACKAQDMSEQAKCYPGLLHHIYISGGSGGKYLFHSFLPAFHPRKGIKTNQWNYFCSRSIFIEIENSLKGNLSR